MNSCSTFAAASSTWNAAHGSASQARRARSPRGPPRPTRGPDVRPPRGTVHECARPRFASRAGRDQAGPSVAAWVLWEREGRGARWSDHSSARPASTTSCSTCTARECWLRWERPAPHCGRPRPSPRRVGHRDCSSEDTDLRRRRGLAHAQEARAHRRGPVLLRVRRSGARAPSLSSSPALWSPICLQRPTLPGWRRPAAPVAPIETTTCAGFSPATRSTSRLCKRLAREVSRTLGPSIDGREVLNSAAPIDVKR